MLSVVDRVVCGAATAVRKLEKCRREAVEVRCRGNDSGNDSGAVANLIELTTSGELSMVVDVECIVVVIVVNNL